MERTALEAWIDEIAMEDLPESYQPVAEAIGIPAAVRLAIVWDGAPFYIPKLDRLLQTLRDRKIVAEFRGNYRELSQRYDLSENRVRDIIAAAQCAQNQQKPFE